MTVISKVRLWLVGRPRDEGVIIDKLDQATAELDTRVDALRQLTARLRNGREAGVPAHARAN